MGVLRLEAWIGIPGLRRRPSVPRGIDRKRLYNFQYYVVCQHLHGGDWHRTVYIDTLGVGTTDFDLSDSRKKDLVASGKKATEDYLKWWSDESQDLAINHPASTA